jgi:nucleoside-diphosphate-sugar epimerase
MRYLITGGAGFIGSNLAETLVSQGERVRILDDFSTGKRENLHFAGAEQIEICKGDIRQQDICRQAMIDVDYILHHAAMASVPLSVQSPLLCHDINVNGTLNLLMAARDAGVERFVLASSSAVYGDVTPPPSAEQHLPFFPQRESLPPSPLSPYAVSKVVDEIYCRIFTNLYGLQTICLRYFNIFGPRQDPASTYAAVIPQFITALLQGRSPTIYGDGLQSRDFIYIRDIVQANIQACRAHRSACGKVYNIARGEPLSVLDLWQRLCQGRSAPPKPQFAPKREGDIRHSVADISQAIDQLLFRPAASLQDGITETISWYQAQLAS